MFLNVGRFVDQTEEERGEEDGSEEVQSCGQVVVLQHDADHRGQQELAEPSPRGGQTTGQAQLPVEVHLEDGHGGEVGQPEAQPREEADREVEDEDVGLMLGVVNVEPSREKSRRGHDHSGDHRHPVAQYPAQPG